MVLIYISLLILIVAFFINFFGLPENRLPPPPQATPDKLMKNANPYRYEGDSGIAFLICHGYGGSPFNTKPLGKYLNSLGHTSIGVLLPGHGTDIMDMQKTRFYHWEEFLERKYIKERSKYKKIFLVGFSMGGSVSLSVAAKNADSFRPAGIITISTPVFFNGFYNGKLILHNISIMFTGIMKIFQPYLKIDKKRPVSAEKLNPWVGYKYVHALDALHSFKKALHKVRSNLPRITVPYCSIMAANDRTVSSENQAYIYNHVHSREKRALMFILPPDMSSMHSILTHKRVNRRVFRYIESFVDEILVEQKESNENQTRSYYKNIINFFKINKRRKVDFLGKK